MNLPKVIIRLDDGIPFVLNKKTVRYSIELPRKHSSIKSVWSYTYEDLMVKHPGKFKVADGTEDLEKIQRNWFEKCQRAMDSYGSGHGDEDDN